MGSWLNFTWVSIADPTGANPMLVKLLFDLAMLAMLVCEPDLACLLTSAIP